MRALVLGGSGHVGAALVREALARGCEVRVVSRRGRPTPNLADLPIEHIARDLDDRAALRGLVRGGELVIDAAAPYPLAHDEHALARASTRMRTLVREVGEGGATLAYVGSFTTLPHDHDARSLALRASHPYFALKQALEQIVLDACGHGLRAVLVNPGAFLGPWDGKPAEQALVPMLLRGAVPAIASAEVSVIDVRDVATHVFEALAREDFARPHALPGHDLRSEVLAERICALAGVAPPRLRVPVELALLGALAGELAWGLVGRPSPLPALAMLLLHESRPLACEGPPLRSLDTTLRDSIAWWNR